MLGYSDFLEFVLAGDETKVGVAIPIDMDCTHIVPPTDSALATGNKFSVVGIVHMDQVHPSTDGILLAELLNCHSFIICISSPPFLRQF